MFNVLNFRSVLSKGVNRPYNYGASDIAELSLTILAA